MLYRLLLTARRAHLRWAGRQAAKPIGTVGDGLHMLAPSAVFSPENIVLGENVHIGEGAFIRAKGGLTIGSNTVISRNVLIYTQDHDVQGETLPFGDRLSLRPVTIGANVWMGMNVCITPGTTIGDGAIVGMGTVVSGDVPPMAVIASQKWRQIGQRDQAHYDQLVEQESYRKNA